MSLVDEINRVLEEEQLCSDAPQVHRVVRTVRRFFYRKRRRLRELSQVKLHNAKMPRLTRAISSWRHLLMP
jgi:hypothetical protein